MEEMNSKGKKNNTWIWIAIVVVILLILFFVFKNKSGNNSGENMQEKYGKSQGGNTDINSLDIGNNPDLGVDDFNSLPVSNEEIAT